MINRLMAKLKQSASVRAMAKATIAPFVCWRPKIFCISRQRSGTTSVGQFLKDHGIRVLGWGAHSVEWSNHTSLGNYEAIFRSVHFRSAQAFEDNPWWHNEFYKYLSFRFPSAKFILLERDSDKWFDSMLNHPSISAKAIAESYRHCWQYRRLGWYYQQKDSEGAPANADNALFPMRDLRSHYISVYEEHNREAKEHFQKVGPGRLFCGSLDDPEKWMRLGRFLQIEVAQGYDVHANRSAKQERL